jgi:hypothetical protein
LQGHGFVHIGRREAELADVDLAELDAVLAAPFFFANRAELGQTIY